MSQNSVYTITMRPDYRLSRLKNDVEITQKYRAESPEIPAVILNINSKATSSRTVVMEYQLPEGLSIDSLRFAKGWGGDYWTTDTDEDTISYARTIDPQMEVKTIIGFKDIGSEPLSTLLEPGPSLVVKDDSSSEPNPSSTETSGGPEADPGGSSSSSTTPQSSTVSSESGRADEPETEFVEPPREHSVQRELGAFETRIEVLEEDIQGFGVFESELETLLGDPTDPFEDGEFEQMKEDLEILAEMVSDIRAGGGDHAVEDVQREVERLGARIEGQEEALENFRSDLTSQLNTVESRLDNLEKAHSNVRQEIIDRLSRLEEASDIKLESGDQGATTYG